MKNRISIISKNINSSDCCGEILKEDFIIPTIRSYMENYLYNGCLNRKISIDESGEIKNCPSMKRSYGNISEKSIFDVAKNENFQEFWKINKMQILICKDCEYRCICTDCRAFISEPENIYSKPSKCSYNPHTLKW
ncbi:MAG: SPASM domain-containing protein [Bacteroidales bacterium]|jgi:SPASM domain peptide maturase of grasp-with-spasm system|nr:SPASM domain-containing protein [Bacteroidales bacterium]